MPRKKKFLRFPTLNLPTASLKVKLSKRDLDLFKSTFSKNSPLDKKWESTVLLAAKEIRDLTNEVEASLEESPTDFYLKSTLYLDPQCSVKVYKECSKCLEEHISNIFAWLKSDRQSSNKLLTKNEYANAGQEISSLPISMKSEKIEKIFEADSEQYEDLFSLLLYGLTKKIVKDSQNLAICKNDNCQSLFEKDGKRQFCSSGKCKQDYFNDLRTSDKRKQQSPAYRNAEKRKPLKKK